MIPRIKNWVKTFDPGIPVGITEYNWGAEGHINGATAQADILGIFGREALDVAARWETPDTSTPTYKAIKMYRNYDGQKSTFGETSVSATVPNPDNLSAFAALRSSDGAMTVMVVNKVLTGSTPITVNLAGFTPGASVAAWQLTSKNSIQKLATAGTVSSSSLAATVPAQSITLFVIPPGVAAPTGDANLDNPINVADAILTLQFAVGLKQPTSDQLHAADMNSNGTMEVTDAIVILKKITGQ